MDFITAICLCLVCVCCDSLGPGRMDHASHPGLPAEITSTTLTPARTLHLGRHPLLLCVDLSNVKGEVKLVD